MPLGQEAEGGRGGRGGGWAGGVRGGRDKLIIFLLPPPWVGEREKLSEGNAASQHTRKDAHGSGGQPQQLLAAEVANSSGCLPTGPTGPTF